MPTITALLPTIQRINIGTQWFRTAQTVFQFFGSRSGFWNDPPTTDGFHFSMAPNSNSLFTRIAELPSGINSPNIPFTVAVGNTVLGLFNAGQSVDFTTLLGGGVREFSITGINPGVDGTNSLAFPVKLDFNTETADFNMVGLETEPVPEPLTVFGTVTFGIFLRSARQRRKLAISAKTNS